jgi:hypothetical protein
MSGIQVGMTLKERMALLGAGNRPIPIMGHKPTPAMQAPSSSSSSSMVDDTSEDTWDSAKDMKRQKLLAMLNGGASTAETETSRTEEIVVTSRLSDSDVILMKRPTIAAGHRRPRLRRKSLSSLKTRAATCRERFIEANEQAVEAANRLAAVEARAAELAALEMHWRQECIRRKEMLQIAQARLAGAMGR